MHILTIATFLVVVSTQSCHKSSRLSEDRSGAVTKGGWQPPSICKRWYLPCSYLYNRLFLRLTLLDCRLSPANSAPRQLIEQEHLQEDCIAFRLRKQHGRTGRMGGCVALPSRSDPVTYPSISLILPIHLLTITTFFSGKVYTAVKSPQDRMRIDLVPGQKVVGCPVSSIKGGRCPAHACTTASSFSSVC